MNQNPVSPFHWDWSKHCSFCVVTLLSQESDGWFCNKGRRRLPRLPECEELLQPLLDRYSGRLSAISRRVNNLFAFSAIGTTGRFVQFQGLANVVLEGRVYHRLLDVAEKDHSMDWFLYDETGRADHAKPLDVPQDVVKAVRSFHCSVNPYVHSLSHAISQTTDQASPLAIELCVPPAGGKLAAVINTENLR
jgi:hypothetical protein